MKDKTVLGLFVDRIDAETAVNELGLLGIRARDIAIVMKSSMNQDKGALAGLLTSSNIVGLGALLIGGPFALGGGLIGGLVNFGLSEGDAKVYEDKIREGNILLAIPANSENEYQIIDILNELGAHSVQSIDMPTRGEVDHYTFNDGYQPRSGTPAYARLGTKGGRVDREDEGPVSRVKKAIKKIVGKS
jgi:hypothetical protein